MRKVLAGVALIAHAFAHAVFPARGFGAREVTLAGRLTSNVAWMVAVIAFLVAGVGLMGARPYVRGWRGFAVLGVIASTMSLLIAWQPNLLFSALVDVAVLVLVASARPERLGRLVAPARQISAGRRVARGIGTVLATALVAFYGITALTRPWRKSWGATPADIAANLPGDPTPRDKAVELDHAIEIEAPPSAVWPWLMQIGQDRSGFYSYTFLENALGLEIVDRHELHPEWRPRKAGDFIPAAPAGWLFEVMNGHVGWPVEEVVPNRALVLRNWGTFALLPQRDGTTHLLIRGKFGDRDAPVLFSALDFAVLDLPHWIMQQRMMRTIRDLAEAHAHDRPRTVGRRPRR